MTIIAADTTCGLSRQVLEQRGIPVVPQVVIFGDQSYHDDGELDTAEFLKKLKASRSLPKTAAPEPALYFPIFERARDRGESVVVIAPSAKISGTVRSALTAAEEFPGMDIRVVDTLTVSCNLGSLVLVADDMAKSGSTASEIERAIQEMIPRGRLYFVVDTLEYLAKGGRIGGARALLGELIQIKPILTIREGQAEAYEQQRTRKHSLSRLIEIVETQCQKSEASHLAVIQVAAEDEAAALADTLKSRMGLPEVPIYQLPPAIVVHGGPGAMGVGFFVEAASGAGAELAAS
ncbi:MAG TPA: DegV family protein [Anaerolineales bacterium]|nr:DegV family protein [Anaerolineales bacterium]